MKAHLIDTHLLVPRLRSSAKVKVKYQGHAFQKMGVLGSLVFQKHLFLVGGSFKALFSQSEMFFYFQLYAYGYRSSICPCFGSESLSFHPVSWEICTVNTHARVKCEHKTYCKSIISIFLFIVCNIFIEFFE